MGNFLSMSGVMGGDEQSVEDALRAYAQEKKGEFESAELTAEDEGCLIISEGINGVTVVYPYDFFNWDDASKELSLRLSKPVFSLHIHDGDLWMYLLFERGNVVDQFNPLPDYWTGIKEDERRAWRGDASKVAQRVPSLSPEEIARYLVPWAQLLESRQREKAYPTDQFHYGDDWQLVDFMGKLGLDYPIDDHGEPHGLTYRFICEPGNEG